MQAVASNSSADGSVREALELRFLPVWAVSKLSRILEHNFGWREVMGLVPNDPWKPGQPIPDGFQYPKKYTWDDINSITEECSRCRREGFEVLLEEWGTSGRQRPTVQDLVFLLKKTEIYQALDYLTVNVLNGEVLPRGNGSDPVEELNQALENERTHQNNFFGTYLVKLNEAPDTSSVAQAINLDKLNSSVNELTNQSTRMIGASEVEVPRQAEQLHLFDPEVLIGMDCANVSHFSYAALKTITNKFSDVLLSAGGNKLGEGAFGKVYFAEICHEGRQRKVAVKRLNAESSESRIELQFKTEIEVLSRCSHENLVPLEGYSCDGPEWCLVYAYMPRGSLQDCLASDNGRESLDWKTRIRIGEGAARGIVYLHTYQERPRVHRDIKSANILLDENMIPKVGDFGLVKLGGRGVHTRTIVKASAVFGTSAYMAPEAFRGDVSVQMDTFSFGVVLLELLTGLPAHDEDREEPDLLNYVLDAQESEGGIENFVDTRAGTWDLDIFTRILSLAILSVETKKKDRPTMVEVLEKYSAITRSMS